ncbi:hypothetical protein BDY21DRAFT_210593 [Lineolata rhizophorae]|uniref:Uncharacterized protein n=1 Tax=Lineolata rhizophorae TaxID=578093 RepID=A0A6A6P3Z6_9PEZI|nr:hypothetical protein BDY21DRAFT_210593 [Lineolata rhizophorae]
MRWAATFQVSPAGKSRAIANRCPLPLSLVVAAAGAFRCCRRGGGACHSSRRTGVLVAFAPPRELSPASSTYTSINPQDAFPLRRHVRPRQEVFGRLLLPHSRPRARHFNALTPSAPTSRPIHVSPRARAAGEKKKGKGRKRILRSSRSYLPLLRSAPLNALQKIKVAVRRA